VEHEIKINQLRINNTQIFIENEGRIEVYSKHDLKFIRTLFVLESRSTVPFTVSDRYLVAQTAYRTLSVFNTETGENVGVCKCDLEVHMFAVDNADEVYLLADDGPNTSSRIFVYSIKNKTMTTHSPFPYASHFAVNGGIIGLISAPSVLFYSREDFKFLNTIPYPEGEGLRRWLTPETISFLHRRKKKRNKKDKTQNKNETRNKIVVMSHKGEEIFTWYVPILSQDKIHCWKDELYFASQNKLVLARLG